MARSQHAPTDIMPVMPRPLHYNPNSYIKPVMLRLLQQSYYTQAPTYVLPYISLLCPGPYIITQVLHQVDTLMLQHQACHAHAPI